MKWQNGDRLEIEAILKESWIGQNGDRLGWIEVSSSLDLLTHNWLARYEGDWVAGLREGKGKYLSKPTGEMSYIEMATTIER